MTQIYDYDNTAYDASILDADTPPRNFTVGEWIDGGTGGPLFAQDMDDLRDFLAKGFVPDGPRCVTVPLRVGVIWTG